MTTMVIKPDAALGRKHRLSVVNIFAFSLALSFHITLLLVFSLSGSKEMVFVVDTSEPLVSQVFLPLTEHSLVQVEASRASSSKNNFNENLAEQEKQQEKVSNSRINVTTPPVMDAVIELLPASQTAAVNSFDSMAVTGNSSDVGNGSSTAGASANASTLANGQGIAGGGMGKAIADFTPPPEYPARSRLNGESGEVVVVVYVDSNGELIEAKIIKSSGFKRLDNATLKQIMSQWRFQPATRNGIPVDGYVIVREVFELKR